MFKLFLLLMSLSSFADFRQVETAREYVYDFSTSGGTSNTFIDITTAASGTTALPLNAVVEEVAIKVITPFTSSSSSSITFGTQASGSAFFNEIDSSELTDNAIFITRLTTPYYVSGSSDRNVGLTITSGVSVTGGKARVRVKSWMWGED